jgi:hypothetical protein
VSPHPRLGLVNRVRGLASFLFKHITRVPSFCTAAMDEDQRACSLGKSSGATFRARPSIRFIHEILLARDDGYEIDDKAFHLNGLCVISSDADADSSALAATC